jgi:pyruvoyl-dependent arginine decarboxylase (PvlArgDC)
VLFRVELAGTVSEMEARIQAEQDNHSLATATLIKAHADKLEGAREGWTREKRGMAERHAEELFEATKDAHAVLGRKEAAWGEEHASLLESWRREALGIKEAHSQEMKHEIEQASMPQCMSIVVIMSIYGN